MRPLTVLLGVVMGSSVALSVSLTMTAIVFALLPEYALRLSAERWPLIKGLLWSWSLLGVSASGFFGELKGKPWVRYPQVLLAIMLAVLLWQYWP